MRCIRVTVVAAIAALLLWPSAPSQAADSAESPDGKSEGTGAVPAGVKDGRYFVTTRVPLP